MIKNFIAISVGTTADEAFIEAKKDAIEYGEKDGEYGTIANKKSFIILQEEPLPTNEAARNLVYGIFELGDEKLEEPDAPAGCYPFKFFGRDMWMFFGWSEG
jgi:hypothetical protein